MIEYYFSFVSQKHIDFALIDKNNNVVKICIELDDSSHFDVDNTYFKENKVKSDITKDILFTYCRVPLLRIDHENYESLIEHIKVAMKMKPKVVTYAYSAKNQEKYRQSMEQLMSKM